MEGISRCGEKGTVKFFRLLGLTVQKWRLDNTLQEPEEGASMSNMAII